MPVAPFVLRNAGGHFGRPDPRADGRLQIRGEAPYAVEHHPEGMLYGFPVLTTVPAGRITAIHTDAAEATPGVVAVVTHHNVPTQAPLPPADAEFFSKLMGSKPVLVREDVLFHGQYVALVVPASYETARAAAPLVVVAAGGEDATPMLDFDAALARAYAPKTINGGTPPDTDVGDVNAALAAVTVDATYDTPYEHCNTMEPHGAVAEWRDGSLHVQDTSQAVSVSATSLAATFQLQPAQAQVESRYVGGGFGSKFGMRPQVVLAAVGAKVTGRPVQVALTRQHNYTDYGHPSHTRQRLRLGADATGRLTAFPQECWLQTSMDDEFVEQCGAIGRMMYAAPTRRIRHRVATMHTPTPGYMRAPGENPGAYAIERARDELAHTLGMDPIALRRVNEPGKDPDTGLPWSSRSLLACLEQAAARFGWDRRDAVPGRVQDGRWLVGMGVAGGAYPTRLLPASATLTLDADGAGTVIARVELAAADIGTGAYTILRQIAAEALGLHKAQIHVEIGDSTLPATLGAAGSSGTASFGSAVAGAAEALRAQLAELARNAYRSPLQGVAATDLVLASGRLGVRDDPAHGEALRDLLARTAPDGMRAQGAAVPDAKPAFAMHAFGAQFAEVGVDVDTGEVRIRRLLDAFSVGRVVNPRTTRSQLIGGMIMGVGEALMEETVLDPRWGQWVNRDLAEYHVPVHADIPAVEAFWVEEDDPHVNPLGVKGVGEIAIVGVAAAVANAVSNATGARVRDLPITLDKLLASLPAGAS